MHYAFADTCIVVKKLPKRRKLCCAPKMAASS